MSVQTTKDSQINYRIELLPRPSSPEVARRILSILDESLSDKILTPSHHHRLMHSTDRDSAARAFFLSTLGPRFDPSNVNADWQEEDPGLACEVWTSSDAEGIQGVMTFNLPDKSHTYE
ncbi:uncharacterized protein I303_102181 [Kwoniella dejecticola CBS 10117]|uniref:Uncharacterized protein n=1 Tax=Kwoniella dejecticola CBS 10117 TaxID=1296121 RepID=A0A1A6ABN9_9TREE|nr:uncharacterized protein I303_01679 [Kwoniella dejecticola CBS 10117]OBR87474.1 hypothetical protein I303_01679 [Kwoniella dejecticola CBS 10117]